MVDHKLGISIKGVVANHQNEFLLAMNPRNEWELLGGRIEPNESPRETLAREVKEEAGIDVTVEDQPLDAYIFDVLKRPLRQVFIVTYPCRRLETSLPVEASCEHSELRWFGYGEALALANLPSGYKRSIVDFNSRGNR